MHKKGICHYLSGVLRVTAAFSGLGFILVTVYWLSAELLPGTVDGYLLTWLPPAPELFLLGALVGAAFGFPVALATAAAVFATARSRAAGEADDAR